jgi:hypothetical protein
MTTDTIVRCNIVDCDCGAGPMTCAGCDIVTIDSFEHPEVADVTLCESCVEDYFAEIGA